MTHIPENDAHQWGHPVTGHIHTAGMRCNECRVADGIHANNCRGPRGRNACDCGAEQGRVIPPAVTDEVTT